jgi:hypothetical protein
MAAGAAHEQRDQEGVDLSSEARKDDYLARLPAASERARWVCAADKIHNGSSILADLHRTREPDTVSGRLVAGRFSTGAAGGYRVERVAAIEETTEDIYNAITIDYAPFAASHEQFQEFITVAGVTGWSGIEVDPVVEDVTNRDPGCEYSQRLYGTRPLVVQTGISDDHATILALAATKAARHALPKQLTAYQGGCDLLDFRKYDVVSVYDTTPGAAFEDDLAIVTAVTLVDANTVQLDLAIDTDIIRSPTVRRT